MISKQQGSDFFTSNWQRHLLGDTKYSYVYLRQSCILSSFINLRNSVPDNDQKYKHIPRMLRIKTNC